MYPLMAQRISSDECALDSIVGDDGGRRTQISRERVDESEVGASLGGHSPPARAGHPSAYARVPADRASVTHRIQSGTRLFRRTLFESSVLHTSVWYASSMRTNTTIAITQRDNLSGSLLPVHSHYCR